jgi:hypothetical protein
LILLPREYERLISEGRKKLAIAARSFDLRAASPKERLDKMAPSIEPITFSAMEMFLAVRPSLENSVLITL